MSGLDRDPLFVALTKPLMFAGVTYIYFVVNMVVTTEVFLIFHTVWALAIAVVVHLTGVVISLGEPRIVDLWIARVSLCPRVPNYSIWRCNSYRP
jgi:type IV secretion system protein VirB3